MGDSALSREPSECIRPAFDGMFPVSLPRMGKLPRNPLGKQGPWSWALEPVRGCNLRCGHCATRLFDHGPIFISEFVWRKLWETIGIVSPKTRVEMANAGEPTLHSNLLGLVRMARELSPYSQIQITTNGTKLASGDLTYRSLFDAGINIVYVDMYASSVVHEKLARESGEQYYFYHAKPKGAPGAWAYTSPELRLIVLMEQPANWPRSRRNLRRLGTFYNHLDWEAASPFGLRPVVHPPRQGCTQPFRYVSVHVDGSYELCCQDFMGETAGTLGTVLDGPSGFMQFWFGMKMQDARRKLRARCRSALSECARCSITFSRSNMRMWGDEQLESWWDGKQWLKLPDVGSIGCWSKEKRRDCSFDLLG